MDYLVDIINSLDAGFHQIERTDGDQRGAIHIRKSDDLFPKWTMYLRYPPSKEDWKSDRWRIVNNKLD